MYSGWSRFSTEKYGYVQLTVLNISEKVQLLFYAISLKSSLKWWKNLKLIWKFIRSMISS